MRVASMVRISQARVRSCCFQRDDESVSGLDFAELEIVPPPPNGKADLRRTIRSATPPGVGRRLIQRLVYARHGRDCMGCKSPVRDWEPEGDQQTK